MRLIELHEGDCAGMFAMVDDADFELLNLYRWRSWKSHHTWYARTKSHNKTVLMHRLLLDSPVVDHADGNGLNNQRGNLRPATNSQNRMNASKRTHGNSEYKGVSKHDRHWEAGIRIRGKRKHLGCFKQEIDAAKAYDEAALVQFGEFASLNFPSRVGAMR